MVNEQLPASFQRVAHRGGAALAPENTLAAFRHARTLPVDAIEFDVQMSRDGHALVFHDETLERLTNGRGNMLDLDLAYLRSLDVAAHFPGSWSEPQRMPLLTEALDFARSANLFVYLEIKASRRDGIYGRYPGIAEAVAREVLQTDMLSQVLLMSFDWAILPQVKSLAPGASTALLVSDDVWEPGEDSALVRLAEQARILHCEWINIDYKLFRPEMVAVFHQHGLRLGVWTVNDEPGLRRLAAAGVDSLTSDRPDLFL
jgi:glycerophosphoryl diester phosphodiesterase